MSVSSVVSAYVSNWLRQHNKSYQWLADELNVSNFQVQHMINGTRTITSERIFQLSAVLGVPVSELIYDKKAKEYIVHVRGEISTREGESALQNVIFSCLKDNEIYYANEILKNRF